MGPSMAERLSAEGSVELSTREFSSWMVSEQKRIFLLCRRLLQDTEDDDGATQDTFLTAWQSLSKTGKDLEESGKWLTRIAVNTCLDRLRSRRWQFWKKRPSPEDETAILNLAAATAPNAED